jgi:cobalt transporter subunit CbtA
VFRRIAAAGLGAGFIVGLVIALLQQFTLVPIIRQAEVYEQAAHDGKPLAASESDHSLHGVDAASAVLEARGKRFALTVFFTIGLAVGYGLLLTGAVAVSGRMISGPIGLLWGIGGFATFALAPSLGLAPELPGAAAADLLARQAWWIGCAVATASGLALLVFGSRGWAVTVGVALLAAPHLIGAPYPGGHAVGSAPPELAAEFAASSLVIAAVFWSLLGWTAGTLYSRLAPDTAPSG